MSRPPNSRWTQQDYAQHWQKNKDTHRDRKPNGRVNSTGLATGMSSGFGSSSNSGGGGFSSGAGGSGSASNMSAYRQQGQSSQNQGSGNAQYSAYSPRSQSPVTTSTSKPSDAIEYAGGSPHFDESTGRYTSGPNYKPSQQSGGGMNYTGGTPHFDESTGRYTGGQNYSTTTSSTTTSRGGSTAINPGLQRAPSGGGSTAINPGLQRAPSGGGGQQGGGGGSTAINPGLQALPGSPTYAPFVPRTGGSAEDYGITTEKYIKQDNSKYNIEDSGWQDYMAERNRLKRRSELFSDPENYEGMTVGDMERLGLLGANDKVSTGPRKDYGDMTIYNSQASGGGGGQQGGSTAISPGLQRAPTGGGQYFDPGLQRAPTGGGGRTQQQAMDERMKELAADPRNYRNNSSGGQYFDPGLQRMPTSGGGGNTGGNTYGETIRTTGQFGTQVGFDGVNYDGNNEDFRFFGKPPEPVIQNDERQRYGKTAQELFIEENPGADPSGKEFEKFRNLLPFTHGGVTNQNYLDPGALPSWDSTLQDRRYLDLETTNPRQFEQLQKDKEADRAERQFQETGWRPQQYSPEVAEKMRNPDWNNLSAWHKELIAMQEGRPIEDLIDKGEDANERRLTDINQVPPQGGTAYGDPTGDIRGSMLELARQHGGSFGGDGAGYKLTVPPQGGTPRSSNTQQGTSSMSMAGPLHSEHMAMNEKERAHHKRMSDIALWAAGQNNPAVQQTPTQRRLHENRARELFGTTSGPSEAEMQEAYDYGMKMNEIAEREILGQSPYYQSIYNVGKEDDWSNASYMRQGQLDALLKLAPKRTQAPGADPGYYESGNGLQYDPQLQPFNTGLPENPGDYSDADIELINKRQRDSNISHLGGYYRGEDGNVYQSYAGQTAGGEDKMFSSTNPYQGGSRTTPYFEDMLAQMFPDRFGTPQASADISVGGGGGGGGGSNYANPYGFTPPDPGMMHTQATVPYHNPTTGETWAAPSGGYTAPKGWVEGEAPAPAGAPPVGQPKMSQGDLDTMQSQMDDMGAMFGNLDSAPNGDELPDLDEVQSQYAPVMTQTTGVSRPTQTASFSTPSKTTTTSSGTQSYSSPSGMQYTPGRQTSSQSVSQSQSASAVPVAIPQAQQNDSAFYGYADNMANVAPRQQSQPAQQASQPTMAQSQPAQQAYSRPQSAPQQSAPQQQQQAQQFQPVTMNQQASQPQAAAPQQMQMQPQYAQDDTMNMAPGSVDIDAIAQAYGAGTTYGATTGLEEAQAKQQQFDQMVNDYQGPTANYGLMGGGSTNDFGGAMAQRDAFINRINEARRPAFANPGSGAGRNLDFGSLLEQAGEDVQGGFKNPFSYQNFGRGGPGYR